MNSHSLLHIVVLLIVVGVGLYLIGLVKIIDPVMVQIIRGVVILAVVIWLLLKVLPGYL